jgi:hypothetical protein
LNPIWELFELVLLWTDFEAFFLRKLIWSLFREIGSTSSPEESRDHFFVVSLIKIE